MLCCPGAHWSLDKDRIKIEYHYARNMHHRPGAEPIPIGMQGQEWWRVSARSSDMKKWHAEFMLNGILNSTGAHSAQVWTRRRVKRGAQSHQTWNMIGLHLGRQCLDRTWGSVRQTLIVICRRGRNRRGRKRGKKKKKNCTADRSVADCR